MSSPKSGDFGYGAKDAIMWARNLLFGSVCLVGVVAGPLVGVLPGLGPTAALAILLPSIYAFLPRRR